MLLEFVPRSLKLMLLLVLSSIVARPSPAQSMQTDGLVAVLGEDRARLWGMTRQILVIPGSNRVIITEGLGFVSVFDAESLVRVNRFRAHPMRCLELALLDFGSRLVTISVDGTVRLWDIAEDLPKKLDELPLVADTASGTWLTMSAASQGHRLVVRSNDQMVLLDLSDDKLRFIQTIPRRQDRDPWVYALSPTGRWLATCEVGTTGEAIQGANPGQGGIYHDSTIVLWDLDSEEPEVSFELKRKELGSLAFSNDESTLAGVDPEILPERQLHLWRLEDGSLVEHEVASDTAPSQFSPMNFHESNEKILYSSGMSLDVLQRTQGTWETAVQLPLTGFATCQWMDGDSILVATTTILERWDLVEGEYKKRPSPKGHLSYVMAVSFDARRGSLLSAGTDALREWSLDGVELQSMSSTELDFENVAKFWPWGRKGFLLKRDVAGESIIQGIVRGREIALSRFRINLGESYENDAWSAAMHPNGTHLVTGHWDSTIRLWRISAEPTMVRKWDTGNGHVCDLAFSPDGAKLASVGWRHSTIVWELDPLEDSAAPKQMVMGKHQDIVRSVAWSPDGHHLASGGEDGQIFLWNANDPGSCQSLMHEEDGPATANRIDQVTISTLQFNARGTQLLSGDAKGRLALWSVEDKSLIKKWQLFGWIWDAGFSPDGTLIATGNGDGTVYLLKAPEDERDD